MTSRRDQILARARATRNGQIVDPIERARRKPTSLRAAITAKCWDCIGGYADKHPRQRIADCTASKCPLHPHRPYQHLCGRGESDIPVANHSGSIESVEARQVTQDTRDVGSGQGHSGAHTDSGGMPE